MTVSQMTEAFLLNMGYSRADAAEPDVVEEYAPSLARWLNEGYARAVQRLCGREAAEAIAPLRVKQYTEEYGLTEKDAKILVGDVALSNFFDAAVAIYPNYKNICNFVLTELLRRLKETETEGIPFSAEYFAQLVKMVDDGKVSRNDGKTVLRYMLENPASPEEIAKANGFLVANDMNAVNDTVDAVLSELKVHV